MREFRNWYRQAWDVSHETYALLPNSDNIYSSFRNFYSACVQIYNTEEELLGREYHQVEDHLVASRVMYRLQDVIPDILTSIVHARSADMFWGEAPALPNNWLSEHDDQESIPPSPPLPPSLPMHDPVSPTPSFLNDDQLPPS